MKHSNFNIIPVIAAALLLFGCGGNGNRSQVKLSPIMEKALNEKDSKFYADFASFPKERAKLPIGVFDSGTGGLTVLEVLLKNDMVNNVTGEDGPDGIPDLAGENFQYLADRANMPYGNYKAAGKEDFFKELVVKDALFLLGNKYYNNNVDSNPLGEKERVKILIIACNTATAYGLADVETLLSCSGTGIKVIGVINAGVRALFGGIEEQIAAGDTLNGKNFGIGVIATAGTIASNAYQELIAKTAGEKGIGVSISSRGAIGIAESVDMEKDYVDESAVAVRDNYKGPVLGDGDGDIHESMLPLYNFNKENNGYLEKTEDGKLVSLQLNSSENYARFHLVSLIDNYLKNGYTAPLSRIIMGCTHYPFLINTFKQVVAEMREYKENGEYVYRDILPDNVVFIDPAIYTAKECAQELRKDNQMAVSTDDSAVRAFISVPKNGLDSTKVDADGNLTYNFKYGREYGTEEEYTVVVPFSRRYLNETTINNIRALLPESYRKITETL